MSSKMSRCFPEKNCTNLYRQWPAPGGQGLRSDVIDIGIVFKGDPGYLKVKTESGRDGFTVTPYSTKATLRKDGVDIKFDLGQTIEEFFTNGPDASKVTVEHELEGDGLNKTIHLLRCFAAWTNSSGSYYGRTSILT